MNELTTMERQPVASAMGVNDILAQVALIQQVMGEVMHEGEHYGKIPGCGDKPTLLQPGAQKLLMTFRLAPEYLIEQTQIDRGHREYRVQCTLKSIGSGAFVGQGVGCCSTMEGKFRFRVAPKKLTDRDVPKEYWDLRKTDPARAQQVIGGKGFSTRKDENGTWKIAEGTDEKIEHDNPADYYNTVLKMAKKRALVDATVTATAASDIFTQDIEDMPEVIPGAAKTQESPPVAAPAAHTTPTQPQPVKAPQQTTSKSTNGELTAECTLDGFKDKTGTSSRGPWKMFICGFTDSNDQSFEAVTFDTKIGDALDSLQGTKVAIRYMPGRKAGTFDLLSISPIDDVTF